VKITIIVSAEMIGTKLSVGVKGTGGEDFDLPTAAMAAMLKTHIDKAVRDFNPSFEDFMGIALEAMAAARAEEAAKKERPQTPANPPEEEFCNLCDAMKKYADSLRADKKGGAE
jgi:non-homologous end joining protein Ku